MAGKSRGYSSSSLQFPFLCWYDIAVSEDRKERQKGASECRIVSCPSIGGSFQHFSPPIGAVLHHTETASQLDHMNCMNYTVSSPVGVAGLISPWFVLSGSITKVVPAGVYFEFALVHFPEQ